jgi:hypothetical protein
LQEMFKGIEKDDPGTNFSMFKKLKAQGVLEGLQTTVSEKKRNT